MMNKTLYWLPRILAFLFAFFIAIFSLDVFQEYSGAKLLIAIILHLLPAIIIFITAIFSLKYDIIGAISFLLYALLYIYQIGIHKPLSWYFTIALPLFCISTLFFLNTLRYNKRK